MSATLDIRKLSRKCIRELSKTLIAERKNAAAQAFSLDDAQRRVVETQSKYSRVVAPAGSGKTRTLIAKAAHLLESDPDARVLCLTFTNAAANEFKQRGQGLNRGLSARLQSSTLNAFGNELIKGAKQSLKVVTPGSKSVGGAYK